MTGSVAPGARFPDWRWVRRLLLSPRMEDAALEQALGEARARQSTPVIWLLGKAQSGKTSIVRALTGSPAAEIGNGFRPCTRTARFYDFPAEMPLVRFLDTRGLGEVAYDPAEDIGYCESQAHLVLGVAKAMDQAQEPVFEVLRTVRSRHPSWPILVAQTGLHEGYPSGAGHRQPYPFDREPWPVDLPADLTRALLAQRHRLGRLAGDAPVRWVPLDLTLPEDALAPADYGLEALWGAIGEVSSLDLRTRLCADSGVQDAFARAAHPHIVGYALAAATLGALPIVDLIAVPALQAKLLHSLAGIYGEGWTRRDLAELFGLLGVGFGVGYGARLAGRSLFKLVPALGQSLGALWGATASGATTYALGKAAVYYFGRRRSKARVDADAIRRVYAEAFAAGSGILRGARGESDGPGS